MLLRQDAVEQQPRIRMRRVIVDIFYFCQFHHPAEIHDHDTVAHMANHVQIMGNENIGQVHFIMQFEQEPENLGLYRDIECGYRLVGDDKFVAAHQREADADSLPLSAGELARIAVHERLVQPGLLQHIDDLFPAFLLIAHALEQ